MLAAAGCVALAVAAPIGALLPSRTAAAQAPASIVDAEWRVVEAGADVGSALADLVAEAPSPSWIAYEVDAVPGERTVCCWNDAEGAGVCSLEERGSVHGRRHGEPSPQGSRLRVLLRVVDGRIQRLRMFTPECTLDAGGLPVAWVRGVATGASLRLLGDLVDGKGALGGLAASDDVAAEAVGAVSLHDAGEATGILAAWAWQGPREVQRAAIFWLGAGRKREGLPVLEELLREHQDADVREHATFGLHVTDTPEAIDALVQAARGDAAGKVRSQALFWLAQRAGERAAATIEGAVQADPDLEVRKRAVFALSQLPADRGVPLLIRIARTHAQPALRKQAVFWLGQSGDERALDFIEELLRARR